ncbi:MAG: accessory Sec system protein Asp3 [Coriobacteriaceae bacterium]|nr:MAG: accessory Sec system protein Asp3 [Coriobacteriaceae bacterium]
MAVHDRIWTVYWTEWGAETYLYGSKICFHAPGDVEFENALMPPGTVIKTWHSMVDYQERRLEPQLPIIDGEGSYHVSVSLEADVPEGIYLRFVFFGKNGDEAGSVVVDQPEADLRCPLKTYSYDAQLICAGAHVLRFHSFTIEELDSQC